MRWMLVLPALVAIFITRPVVMAAPYFPLQSSITQAPPAVGGRAAQDADLVKDTVSGLFRQLEAIPLDANNLLGEWLEQNPAIAKGLKELLADKALKAGLQQERFGYRKLELKLALDARLREVLLGNMAFADVHPDSACQTPPLPRVILDGRHLKLQPALAPRLLDESGSELFSLANARRQDVIQHGLLDYRQEPEALKMADRLTIKLDGLSGKTGCDLVLANSDARLLEQQAELLRPGSILVLMKEEK